MLYFIMLDKESWIVELGSLEEAKELKRIWKKAHKEASGMPPYFEKVEQYCERKHAGFKPVPLHT